jgi:pyruvate dehydrogenase E2 component (dihydrolipoamide acetyltransferase)
LPVGASAGVASNGGRVAASPVARRIAAELGVDLHALAGSGPRGRIVKRDVLVASGAPAAGDGVAAPPPVPPVGKAAAGGPAGGGRGATTVEQATRIQQTIARRMAETKATQPEFALTVEVDMDAAVALRAQLKAAAEAQQAPAPSLNDLVVKAVALALRAHPRANGAYKDGAFELYERVNVGVAVAAPDALLVPVVSDADTLSLGAIAARTRALAARGRDGALTPPELAGGTFTVSNLGMFGIAQFTAILNAGQAGILAVGAVREVPVVRDGELAIGRRMTATLTCDHRILYGADAAQFLAAVRARLEDPFRLIL